MPVEVIVVGGGTGGPAAALFLARAGHRVRLLERVPSPGPVGAGILLQPTGMRVLRELGLLNRVLGHGARVERLEGRTASGRRVLDLRYADLEPGLFGLGIQRGALFAALWDAIEAEPGVTVECGVEALATGEDRGRAWVETAAGRREAERVVVAAGARSELRPPGARVRPYPWGALWWVSHSEVSAGCLTQRYRDTREMVGLLPSGDGTVSGFWSLRADAVDATRAAGVERWKAQVRALLPSAPLDEVRSMDDLVFAPYYDVVAPRWHTERVVWIGDCAHAMSPQLGQGANLALMDAWVLSRVDVLADYSRRRRAHLRFYSVASRLLTPFFQSSFPVLAPLRDLVAGPLHAWGWYRRQMLESLAGAKTGVWGRLEEG